jgi:hypothetical protein
LASRQPQKADYRQKSLNHVGDSSVYRHAKAHGKTSAAPEREFMPINRSRSPRPFGRASFDIQESAIAEVLRRPTRDAPTSRWGGWGGATKSGLRSFFGEEHLNHKSQNGVDTLMKIKVAGIGRRNRARKMS